MVKGVQCAAKRQSTCVHSGPVHRTPKALRGPNPITWCMVKPKPPSARCRSLPLPFRPHEILFLQGCYRRTRCRYRLNHTHRSCNLPPSPPPHTTVSTTNTRKKASTTLQHKTPTHIHTHKQHNHRLSPPPLLQPAVSRDSGSGKQPATHPLKASHHHPFEVQLRGYPHGEVAAQRVVVGHKWPGVSPTGHRLKHRGLHLGGCVCVRGEHVHEGRAVACKDACMRARRCA